MCADGGANRVYDDMPGLFPHEDAVAVRNRSVVLLVWLRYAICLIGAGLLCFS